MADAHNGATRKRTPRARRRRNGTQATTTTTSVERHRDNSNKATDDDSACCSSSHSSHSRHTPRHDVHKTSTTTTTTAEVTSSSLTDEMRRVEAILAGRSDATRLYGAHAHPGSLASTNTTAAAGASSSSPPSSGCGYWVAVIVAELLLDGDDSRALDDKTRAALSSLYFNMQQSQPQQPCYGRTGLLARNGERGLPVRRPRLRRHLDTSSTTSSSSMLAGDVALKWRPSLLTVPQVLLQCLARDADAVSTSVYYYVCIALLIEVLARHFGCGMSSSSLSATTRRRYGELCKRVLQWQCERVDALRDDLNRCYARSRGAAASCGDDGVAVGEWYVPRYDLVVTQRNSSNNNNSNNKNETASSSNSGSGGGERVLGRLRDVTHRAVTLLGRDATVCDVRLDHVSCSAQHAALQMQFVFAREDALLSALQAMHPHHSDNSNSHHHTTTADAQHAPLPAHDDLVSLCTRLWQTLMQLSCGDDDDAGGGGLLRLWSVELQVVDLASTNGTRVDAQPLQPFVPLPLIEGDAITFAGAPLTYLVARSEHDNATRP